MCFYTHVYIYIYMRMYTYVIAISIRCSYDRVIPCLGNVSKPSSSEAGNDSDGSGNLL